MEKTGRQGLGGNTRTVAENTQQVGVEPLQTARRGERGFHVASGSESDFCEEGTVSIQIDQRTS